jgi:hypothetical protein
MCKLGTLIDPFSGDLLEHLLWKGFMDGHTQWMDEDEEEAPHHEEGQQDKNDDGREEPPGHDAKMRMNHMLKLRMNHMLKKTRTHERH